MYINGTIPAVRNKKNTVNPFLQAKSDESNFQRFLRETISEKGMKKDVDTFRNDKSQGNNYKPLYKSDNEANEIEEEKDKNPDVELLQVFSFISEYLATLDEKGLVDDGVKNQVEEISELLESSKIVNDGNGNSVITKELVDRLPDLHKYLENFDIALTPKLEELKTELEHALKQYDTKSQSNQIVTKEVMQPLNLNEDNGKVGSQKTSQELKLSDMSVLEDENKVVGLREGKFNFQFDSEEKDQNSGETKGFVLEDSLNSREGNEKTISFSNFIEDGIKDENFAFQVPRSGTSFELNIKENIPMQRQVFNSILEQVDKAHIHVGEQESEMHLQLKPDNLGNLSLKIAIEKGIVVAKIIAENQVVKETLESNFSLLKDALNDKGFGVQELSVSVGHDSNFKNRHNFEQFKKFKSGRFRNELVAKQNSALSHMGDQTPTLNSSIDFFA